MIEDYGFVDRSQSLHRQGIQQERMPADPVRLVYDGGVGTAQNSGGLPGGVAGHESGCDLGQQASVSSGSTYRKTSAGEKVRLQILHWNLGMVLRSHFLR